jgi:phosphate transport system permease protein
MSNAAAKHLKKRYAAERRFKAVGLLAVLFSGFVLAFLLFNMTSNAVGGFKRWELRFPVDLAAGRSTGASCPAPMPQGRRRWGSGARSRARC